MALIAAIELRDSTLEAIEVVIEVADESSEADKIDVDESLLRFEGGGVIDARALLESESSEEDCGVLLRLLSPLEEAEVEVSDEEEGKCGDEPLSSPLVRL